MTQRPSRNVTRIVASSQTRGAVLRVSSAEASRSSWSVTSQTARPRQADSIQISRPGPRTSK